MQVPISRQSIGIESGGGLPTPALQPITQAASGVNVAESKAALGGKVQDMGQKLFDHIEAQRHIDLEQEVNDRAIQWKKDAEEQMRGATTLTGVNARSATLAFDKNALDLKAKYAKDLNPNQLKQYDRLIDTHHEVMRSVVISHEASETRKAREDGQAARAESDFSTAAYDGGKSIASQNLIDKGMSEIEDLYRSKGYDDDRIKLEKQKGYDLIAKNILAVHPEEAGRLLIDMPLSPEGRAMVVGKFLDVKANSLFLDPSIKRNPDGSPNLSDVTQKVNSLTKENGVEYNQDMKDKIIKLFEEKDQDVSYVLKSKNNSFTQAFNAEALKPEMPIEEAKKLAVKYGDRLRNGQLDYNDVNQKLRMIDLMHREKNGTSDSATFLRLHESIDKEGTVTLQELNDAREAGLLAKSDHKSLVQFMQSPRPQVMTNRFKMIEDSLAPANVKEKKDFMLALHQEVNAKKLTDPNDVQKLAEIMSKASPTGAKGFFNRISFGILPTVKEEKEFKMVALMQANPDLLRAVGGQAEVAVALGQKIGGVNKLAKDTPESKAVIALLATGEVKPEQITMASINAVIKQYPELFK